MRAISEMINGSNGRKLDAGKVYLAFVFMLLYAPIIYLMYYSFNAAGNMRAFEGFTLEWYGAVLQDRRMIAIVLDTLIVALLSASISTIIGVAGALAIQNMRTRRMRNTLLTLNNVMIVSPDVIIGASFLMLFVAVGMELGFATVLLAHVAFSVPIVVLMVLPKLQEMSPTLIYAALDLGASKWDVLTRVIVPYISPGILAGFFMALTYSLDDFAVTFFVTGGGFTTLSVEIYSLARRGISLTINALSTLMFLATLVLVVGYYFIATRQTRESRGAEKPGDSFTKPARWGAEE